MFLEGRIKERETNRKGKYIRDLCRGMNLFKKGYQVRTNLVIDEKGDLLADFHTYGMYMCFST
jgi:hypothetical protein